MAIYSVLEGIAFPMFIASLLAWSYILFRLRKKSQKLSIMTSIMVIEIIFSFLALAWVGLIVSLILVIYPYTAAILHTRKVRKTRRTQA